MKLELKHLAPYLPYGLKMDVIAEDGFKEVVELNIENIQWTQKESTSDSKPILRPLSELLKDKEIVNLFEHEAIQLDDYTEEGYRFFCDDESVYRTVTQLMYDVVEAMFEKHFDVFGLIEKGLAIDINNIDA